MATNIGGVLLGELILGSSLTEVSGGPPTNTQVIVHTLNFKQALKNTNTKVITQYIPYQIIGLTQTSSKTVDSTLNLSHTIVGHKVLGVSSNLNLTQTIDEYAAKSVKTPITYIQTITHNAIHHIEVEQTLAFESIIQMSRSATYNVLSGFGMNQFIKAYREYNKTFEDIINWNQEIRREVFIRSVVDNWTTLGQSLSYTPSYPNGTTDSLVFNQSIGVNVDYRRSVNSQLVFLPTRSIYVGMGDVSYYTMENLQYVKIPAYQQGKKNRPLCILQVPNGAITLPPPDWGDAENYGGVFTIKRSMNGIPYTHVRTLSLRKLKLPWTLAKRKAWELREFLIQHNAELMTLTTWKGDKWFVNLLTNPFELTVKGRYEAENEKVSVELEFEGLKVM